MADAKVVEYLHQILAAEIQAIAQYMDHHARCADKGYGRLADEMEKEAKEEMIHAEKLMERLLFLDAPITYLKHGTPTALTDIEAMLKVDRDLEIAAIQRLASAIKACDVAADYGTKHLLEQILVDEERHLDELKRHLDLYQAHGVQYLLVRG
jgi:bacterioferritin